MAAQYAPMQLDDLKVLELTVVANKNSKADEVDTRLEYANKVDFDVLGCSENKNCVAVPLSLEFKAPRESVLPFEKVAIQLIGFFSAASDEDVEQFRNLVPANCLVILNGAARGLLLAATTAFPNGPFMLPTINYIAIIEKKARQMLNQAKKAQKTTKSQPTAE